MRKVLCDVWEFLCAVSSYWSDHMTSGIIWASLMVIAAITNKNTPSWVIIMLAVLFLLWGACGAWRDKRDHAVKCEREREIALLDLKRIKSHQLFIFDRTNTGVRFVGASQEKPHL